MSHEIRADYSQTMLFPPALEDWIPADHPARFIREIVDQLDLKGMCFKVREPDDEGRPNYAADLLLKVWLYGYLERIRSSRRLEKACRQHVALIWLTGMNYPDHNSLWRFWRDNRKVLKEVFQQTVKLAVRAGLVDMAMNAVDGTKITARASTHAVWNRKRLQKLEQQLEQRVAEGMKEVEEAEGSESGEYRLPEELSDALKLRETVREKLAEMAKQEREYMNPAEPQAQMMKNHEGTRLAYNAQVVADAKAGIIVAPEVTVDANDKLQLSPMLDRVKENMGRVAVETTADSGYFSGEQLAEAEKKGCEVLVNLEGVSPSEEEQGPYHTSRFVYDPERDCLVCPRGGVLTYECTVCPSAKRYALRRFRCVDFESCPVRWECSKEERGRSVKLSPYTEAIQRQHAKQKDPEKAGLLKQRMGVVEPVFARIKHHLDFRQWTMGGVEKVRAQWFFVCALANLTILYARWRDNRLRLA